MDDFANRNGMIFPAIIFENVRDDDHATLRPLFMVMNAIDMTLRNQSAPEAIFQPFQFDPINQEYMMACDLPVFNKHMNRTVAISYRMLKCIWSVNPARIRSMCLEPYYSELTNAWFLRCVVRVLSMQSEMLPCTFQLFLMCDKTLLRPGLDLSTIEALPSVDNPLEQETEIIAKIKRLCASMLNNKNILLSPQPTKKQANYSLSDNFVSQRNGNNSATLRWRLPFGGGLDVAISSELWAEIGPSVDDIVYGIEKVDEGYQLYIDIILFSPASTFIRVVDSTSAAFYTDENEASDPWRFNVTGPTIKDHLQRVTSASSTTTSSDDNKAKVNKAVKAHVSSKSVITNNPSAPEVAYSSSPAHSTRSKTGPYDRKKGALIRASLNHGSRKRRRPNELETLLASSALQTDTGHKLGYDGDEEEDEEEEHGSTKMDLEKPEKIPTSLTRDVDDRTVASATGQRSNFIDDVSSEEAEKKDKRSIEEDYEEEEEIVLVPLNRRHMAQAERVRIERPFKRRRLEGREKNNNSGGALTNLVSGVKFFFGLNNNNTADREQSDDEMDST